MKKYRYNREEDQLLAKMRAHVEKTSNTATEAKQILEEYTEGIRLLEISINKFIKAFKKGKNSFILGDEYVYYLYLKFILRGLNEKYPHFYFDYCYKVSMFPFIDDEFVITFTLR